MVAYDILVQLLRGQISQRKLYSYAGIKSKMSREVLKKLIEEECVKKVVVSRYSIKYRMGPNGPNFLSVIHKVKRRIYS